jgi:predicted lactoylglutathione lyase
MNSKQIWVNLAVTDVNRTTAFYNTLGCKPNGTPNKELTSFLFADNQLVIHFFLQTKLEKAMGTPAANLANGSEVMFSLSASSEEEVTKLLNLAKEAGGSIFKPAQRDEQGYYWGGFADPDGHQFNVLLLEPGM